MKHPTDEQWTVFLYDESPATEAAELSNHLERCPICAAQVRRLRDTMRQLNAWQIEEPKRDEFDEMRKAGSPVLHFIRWAGAAAALIAVGFLIGRGRGLNENDLAVLKAELRSAAELSAISASERVAVQLNGIWETGRRQDWMTIAGAIDQIQSGQRSLRNDLETVAVAADAELARTKRDIRTLVSINNPDPLANPNTILP